MAAEFGVRLPVAGPLANRDSIRRGAVEAERLGYDTLWVHDYLVWNQELDSMHISCGSKETFLEALESPDYVPKFYESLSNLAFVAGITDRIRLGAAVLCLPYREPLATAKQIATIDDLSGGRVDLGIGQGAAKSTRNVEFEVMGIDRATKVKHTREMFEAMREVWINDVASFRGEFYEFEGAQVYPKPAQAPHPPIWIGGVKDLSLKMIADYADGWLSFWITPEQFPTATGRLNAMLEERGREPDSLKVGTEIHVYLESTVEKARRDVNATMRAFDDAYEGTSGTFALEAEVDHTAEMWNSSLIGTPETVSERIAAYMEAGCTVFEMKFIYHNVDHMVEQWTRFSEEVAPNFQ